ncbi:MarR family transcriptional regulator [Candidatus Woesearchaeota archaeon]|nr:MarR family transcriptional regulator [Candidatus Woesearchaeota archaeon]
MKRQGQTGVVKDVMLVFGIITGFIFIVTFSSLYVSDAIEQGNACGCVIPIPWMILILSSLGLFVGSLSYYFIAGRFLKARRQRRIDEREALAFLQPDERPVVKAVVKAGRPVTQAEISRSAGLDKVKVSRLVRRLVQRGVLVTEGEGKSKTVFLTPGLAKVFVERQ